jgi:single-stranded-DNA-specific exonuclease
MLSPPLLPVTNRQWHPRSASLSSTSAESLCAALGVSSLTARTLAGRGIDNAVQGAAFMESRLAALPDPGLLPDMDRAVARLRRALELRELILVHGDYDVDGISGTALLVEGLRALGGTVEYHIPLRLKDGYGLSAEALQRAAQAGVRLVVSVDCGISGLEEGQLAARLGLDLIITDHHLPPAQLPPAEAIVNPRLPGNAFPCEDLAGVGVAFFLLAALRRTLREAGAFAERAEPDLRRYLDLVALGTIADLVPLTGVNRILARAGLQAMAADHRPGLRALRQVADVAEVTCGAVGYRLAPRLNAAGRLEDAGKGVELLLCRSPEQGMAIARQLDEFNRERQQIEQTTLQQAIDRLEEGGEGDRRTIVLADARWHSGVIGIVASRLVERYHRPIVLIALADGQGKGSARSIRGFHLYRALASCQEHLQGFGGHEYAAGLTIAAGQVPLLADALEAVAWQCLSEDDLLPRLHHDGEVLLDELTLDAVQELDGLAPFGIGNPQPSFWASGLRIQQPRLVGASHLRFTARQGGYTLPCIAFGMAERQAELQGEIDLLFTPMLNQWRGNVTVQLKVSDMRPSLADAVQVAG